MGISLNGLTPAGTYPGLIKTGDNTAIDGTLKVLSDGNGNNLPMEVSTTGVNLTGSPTVNSVAIANTTQLAAKQDTLVSGTNIKTINGTSVLGSGNIVTPTTPPSGVAGAIQFSDGSAFSSDATNFFWDNTNKRLGIGTNAPTNPLTINVTQTSTSGLLINQTGGTSGTHISGLSLAISGTVRSSLTITPTSGEVRNYVGGGGFFPTFYSNNAEAMRIDGSQNLGIGTTTVSARTHIKGSGSTSATTSLLVQNSAGTGVMKVTDDGLTAFGPNFLGVRISEILPGYGRIRGYNGLRLDDDLNVHMDMPYNQNTRLPRQVIVGANTTQDASSQLQIDSTTKGFLPPRMTTTQKNAIATPAAGLVVYDNTTNKLCCYNGSTWNDLF